jgi:hypothetical protein
VGPRAGLDAVVKRKIPNPRWKSNPRITDRPARSLVAMPTELSRLLNPYSMASIVISWKWILSYGNRLGGCGADASGSGSGAVASRCEHGNESSRFHETGGGDFVTS